MRANSKQLILTNYFAYYTHNQERMCAYKYVLAEPKTYKKLLENEETREKLYKATSLSETSHCME